MCPSNYNRFWDRARYWSKIVNFSYPLTFDAPVRGFPSECRHPVWYGKTRMVWLPVGEKISKISLFVLAQLTNVTDARTDRRTPGDGIYRAYAYASRGKNGYWAISFQNKAKCRALCLTRRTVSGYGLWTHRVVSTYGAEQALPLTGTETGSVCQKKCEKLHKPSSENSRAAVGTVNSNW